MIRPLTLVRLGLTTEHGCPTRWTTRATRSTPAPNRHFCVGDAGHLGKHVCPCGKLLPVEHTA